MKIYTLGIKIFLNNKRLKKLFLQTRKKYHLPYSNSSDNSSYLVQKKHLPTQVSLQVHVLTKPELF